MKTYTTTSPLTLTNGNVLTAPDNGRIALAPGQLSHAWVIFEASVVGHNIQVKRATRQNTTSEPFYVASLELLPDDIRAAVVALIPINNS